MRACRRVHACAHACTLVAWEEPPALQGMGMGRDSFDRPPPSTPATALGPWLEGWEAGPPVELLPGDEPVTGAWRVPAELVLLLSGV